MTGWRPFTAFSNFGLGFSSACHSVRLFLLISEAGLWLAQFFFSKRALLPLQAAPRATRLRFGQCENGL